MWKRKTAHGPAAEEFLEGAECDAETENAAGFSEEAAAAAGVRPPRPSNWDKSSQVKIYSPGFIEAVRGRAVLPG